MSASNWKKYVDKPLEFNGVLTRQPILIADSKGNYLKQHADLIEQFDYFIDFECSPGARLVNYYYWLQRNLSRKVRQYGDIVIYCFVGTCDLTRFIESNPTEKRKRQKFIELRHSSDFEAVQSLIYEINRYLKFISKFPSVKIIFLEIPPYSIREWNKAKGHPDADSFLSQDLALYERLSLVNDYIKEVNSRINKKSPRFTLDLRRTRKSKKRNNYKRVSITFSGYKDGIHPKPLLARCWLKE